MAPLTTKAKSHLRWLLLLPIPVLWCLLAHFGKLVFLENKFLDWRFQYRGEIEAPVKLRYVDIDTRAIQAMGEKPWNRDLFSSVAEGLIVAGGAKAVAFDIVFSDISHSKLVDRKKALEGDRELRRVIQENPMRVVLAAQYTTGISSTQGENVIRSIPLLRKGRADRTKNDVPEMPGNAFVLGPKGPIGRVGLIDVDEEFGGDAVPRWVPLFVHTMHPTLYHMSLQLVLQYHGLDENAVRIAADHLDIVQKDGTPLLTIPLREGQLLEANWFSRWGNPTLNPRCSVADIFAEIDELNSEDKAKNKSAEAFFAQFKDALVLVGPTDSLLQDLAPTPFDAKPVPKVGLHGNLVKTILSERFIVRLPEWALWATAFPLTLIVCALSVAGGARSVLAKLVALLALGGYGLVCFYLFERSNFVLPMAAPLGAAFTTSFAGLIWQVIEEQKAKGRIKGMFSAYLAPTVVNQLIDSGQEPELGGHEEEITAYFSDIQSFSTFSEVMTPARLVELMNEYLGACTDIVQAEGGTLDKYIGDAVVAMFGAPLPLPDHAYRAVFTTIRVQKRIEELRQKWRAEGDAWPARVHYLRARLGLNTGPAIIGNMGSHSRFSYTMMGDNVNLAARMESGAKSLGAYTMITDTTRTACEKHSDGKIVFRFLDKIIVKGRSLPVPVHEVVGLKEDVAQKTFDCLGVHAQAMERYLAQDWDGAIKLFEQSATLEPNQPNKAHALESNPSLIMIQRCHEMKEHPPAKDWDGVYKMKEK